MKIRFLQNLFDDIRGKKRLKIYPPYYNEHLPIVPGVPEIYNKFGDRMDSFFLRDRHSALVPYGGKSRYFLWDRFNYGLDIHFYTGNAISETMGTPVSKYGILVEPRTKQPKDYSVLERSRSLAEEFDAVLTHDAKLLDMLPNAIFFPGCATSWVSILDPTIWQRKTKSVSMLSSRKKMCPLHYLRIAVAEKCKRLGLADTFGTFDGGPFVSMAEVLSDYRYTIAFENEISPYFFTERLTSSFISMTVPIYIGATEVNRFFNPDGIIQITPEEARDIEKVLARCSVEDYEQRLPAVEENYQLAMRYLNGDDLLYEMLFPDRAKRPLAIPRCFSALGHSGGSRGLAAGSFR